MRHFKYLQAASSVTLALALAGCSSTGSSGPSGPSLNDPAAASKSIMNQYAEVAPEADGVKKIEAAQNEAGGVAGFGVATAGATTTSAASTTGTYVLGNVEKTGADTLKIKVGDQVYNLSGGKDGESGQMGFPYMAYGNTAHSSAPGENGAYVLNADYASLAIFTKGGKWSVVDEEDDEWNIENMEGYGMVVTGLQTPKESLPKETADYHGEYYYAAADSKGNGTFGASGSFDMKADFAKSELTGSARVIGGIGDPDDPDHTNFNGTIEGNRFYGTTERIGDGPGMNGQFAGGFYGPNAEEIAGVGYGKAKPENLGGQEVDTSMSFVGKKQ